MRRTNLTASVLAVLAGAWVLAAVAGSHAALVAHYKLDEPAGSGDPVFDSAGTSPGTLINDNPSNLAQGVSPAPFGTAYRFSRAGGLSGAVNLGTSSTVQPADKFTVSFWFQIDTIDDGFERLIESMDGTVSTSRGYRFDLGSNGEQLRALLRDGTGASSSKQHSATLTAGTWYFAAVRYDQDDLLQVTVIDQGTPLSASTIGSATQTAGTPTGAIVYAAGRPTVLAVENSSGGAVNSFQGAMDDVAFWDSVLGNDQLAYVGTHGAAAPIPTLHWNAQDAPVNDGTRDEWLPRVGSGYDWNFENANGPDRVGAEGVYTPITHAYRYTGDENVRFSNTADNSFAFDQLNSTASASFEIWFRPEALDHGKQVLWETGGVNGASITLDDDLLRFGTASSSGSPSEVEVLYTLSPAEAGKFVQVVGVYDKENTETRLYVDGLLVGTVDDVTGNWSGTNAAGLGTQQASAVGGFADEAIGDPFGTFIGDIAIFNFYDHALSSAQVLASFQAVAVPEPASVTLLGAGLLGLCGMTVRRRRRARRTARSAGRGWRAFGSGPPG